jgi:hypothetical protein
LQVFDLVLLPGFVIVDATTFEAQGFERIPCGLESLLCKVQF